MSYIRNADNKKMQAMLKTQPAYQIVKMVYPGNRY